MLKPEVKEVSSKFLLLLNGQGGNFSHQFSHVHEARLTDSQPGCNPDSPATN